MTSEETRQILTVLRTNYPNTFRNMSVNEQENYLSLWSEAFKNDNVNDVINAVKEIIYTDTREFAPNIAQVKARLKESNNILAIETRQSIMKKYDLNYDDDWQYTNGEMVVRFFDNPYNLPLDEVKEDFKKALNQDYDEYIRKLYSYLKRRLNRRD